MKNLAIYDKLVNAEEKTDIRNMTVMFNNQELIQLLDGDLEISQEREEIETEKSEEHADDWLTSVLWELEFRHF